MFRDRVVANKPPIKQGAPNSQIVDTASTRVTVLPIVAMILSWDTCYLKVERVCTIFFLEISSLAGDLYTVGK